jgi:hypothetical protein
MVHAVGSGLWSALRAGCVLALAACGVSEAREPAREAMPATPATPEGQATPARAPGAGREAGRAEATPPSTGPVVLELFTSQGCSSCPPADRLLAELGRRDDVVALSFHVDYWNDLGWDDPFSSPRWSQRQQSYGHELPSRIYTPQLVVHGRQHLVGSNERAVREAMAAQAAQPKQPRLRLAASAKRDGNRVEVAIDRDARDLLAVVALYESDHSTEITSGENSDRTLRNDYVVRQLAYAKDSDAVSIEIDPAWTGALGVAVLLQDQGTMTIHAATKLPLPPG